MHAQCLTAVLSDAICCFAPSRLSADKQCAREGLRKGQRTEPFSIALSLEIWGTNGAGCNWDSLKNVSVFRLVFIWEFSRIFFFFLKKVSSIRPTHKFHINTWLGRHILTCCLLLDILGSLSVLFPKSHKNSRVTTRCVLICFSPVSIKLVDETETKPKINSKFVQLTER